MKTWQERRDEACLTAMSTLGKNADVPGVFYFDGWNAGRTDALREVVAKLKDCGHWGDVDALEKSLLTDLAEQEKEGP